MIAAQTIYDVLIAAIAAVPAILAAIFAGLVALRTKTPNGTKLGQAVYDAGRHAADTNALVRGALGEPELEPEAGGADAG